MNDLRFPAVEQFLASSFHQDWSEEAPNFASAVWRYLSKAQRRTVEALVLELDTLERLNLSEIQLGVLLRGLGCYFNPEAENLSFTAWIPILRSALRDSLERADSFQSESGLN